MGYTPQATADKVAQTPRPNKTAELLALEAANTFVAPELLYQRVAGEVEAIVTTDPSLASISPQFDGYSDQPLYVYFDDAGWPSVLSNSYQAWSCPNQVYGAAVKLNEQWKFAELTFCGKRFNAKLLEQEYAQLPSVKITTHSEIFYDGPDVCLEIQGDQHFFIFDDASGDGCPSGCMYHVYYGFQVGPDAVVIPLGVHDTKLSSPPQWFVDLAIGVFPDLPEEFRTQTLFRERYACVARKGHPKIKGKVTLECFLEMKHVVVAPRGHAGSPVDRVLASRGLKRRAARHVPYFLVALELISRSDCIVTISERLARMYAARFGLQVLAPPIAIPGYTIRQIWHPRVDADPAHSWLRRRVAAASAELSANS